MHRVYRSYWTLFVTALLGPALLFAAMAWWGWQRVNREARAEISRTVDLLHEQAERLLDVDELLLAQIDDRVAGVTWRDIIAHETEVHRFLQTVSGRVDGISGAFLADAEGVVRVLTLRDPALARMDPPSAAVVRDQQYFQAARAGAPTVLDGPFADAMTGRAIFRLSRRLSDPDGTFRGVAVLSLAPRTLVEFWKSILSAGDAAALVRDDGVVLTRVPEIDLHANEPPPRFSAATVAHLRTSEAGVIDTLSAIDGIARITGYRKLQDYPVHVVYAVDKRNVARDWYPTVGAFGALAAAATAGLLISALAVIRRARGEAEALEHAERSALALRESEESQRALFRNAPVPMHALDADGRIIDVNDSWLELFERSREEVTGRSIAEFEAQDEDPDRQRIWADLLAAGGLRDIQRAYVRRSGDVVHALVSATVERSGKGEFVRSINVVTDITDRLRAEDATRREQQFSELLAESSTEGIVGVDRDLRCTVWNRAMEALSEVPRKAVVGQRVFDLRPDLVGTPVEVALRAALLGERTSVHDRPFTIPMSGRSGRYDADVTPLYAPDRSVIGALIFLRDITERHRMEEQLRQAQKMEAIGQLTGGVAHDFNNLLTVVLGSIDGLRRRVEAASIPRSDREFRRLADAALRAAERGALLTERLLAFSRRQPLDPVPVEPNGLVAGMSELLRRTLGERIAIETIVAGGVWRVLADPSQLENAILNLAVNARDAMPRGGRLTIETANVFLDEAYAAAHEDVNAGQYVMVGVSDTGSGMTKEIAAKAFEPFFTTKEVGQGTGLGLSQVYGFVKQSGGHVKIYSEPGKGTTVKIYLPRLISTETAHEPAAGPQHVLPSAHGELILVVEDDEDVRAHGVSVLREMGYRVLAAPDGRIALRLVRSEPEIRLMFTDVGLPGGLNGRQLADAAQQMRPALKVLFTTGYARSAIVHRGRLDPGVELVTKPFTYAALGAKIREMLEAGEQAGED